jgi:hypothetical protein
MAEGGYQLSWGPEERAGALLGGYTDLLTSGDFHDVTLLTEDGQAARAHRIVLAGASPFFKNIFCKASVPDLHLYLSGVDSGQLTAILRFMYRGSTEVPKDHLESFLQAARGLRVVGLVDGSLDKKTEDNKELADEQVNEMKQEEQERQETEIKTSNNYSCASFKFKCIGHATLKEHIESAKIAAQPAAMQSTVGKNLSAKERRELLEEIDKLKAEKMRLVECTDLGCKECGLIFKSGHNYRRHNDTMHSNKEVQCTKCQRSYVNFHEFRIHKKECKFQCTLCPKFFIKHIDFRKHSLKRHPGVDTKDIDMKPTFRYLKTENETDKIEDFTADSFTCELCYNGKKGHYQHIVYKGLSALKAHMDSDHRLSSNTQCLVCKETFEDVNQLNTHNHSSVPNKIEDQ